MVLVVMVAHCYGGRRLFIAVGRRETYPCAGNSHRRGENALERGGDTLAKLKK
jgi:hypothetical protein